MRYLSVCSGIEAATVAWHPLGWTPVAFSEIEKFPSAVLAHHYPDTPNLGDMTQHERWPLRPGSVDLLVGGTPCQSFSVAGLRKGLADPRGNLALTYLAIADRLRPRWLVWENVPGVLSSSGGRDFGSFIGALGELGYGFAYRVLDAQFFGVAQRRRRVFVVGHLGDWRRAAAVLFERESLRGHPAPSRAKGQGAAVFTPGSIGGYREGCGTLRANGGDLGGGSEGLVAHHVVGALTARGPDGMGAAQVDAQHYIPTWWDGSDCAGTLTKEGAGGNQRMPDKDNFGAVLSPVKRDNAAHAAVAMVNMQGSKSNAVAQADGPSYTLNAMHGHDVHAVAFPWQSALDPIGTPRDLSGTLVKNQVMAVATTMAVRRLTPVECERLQGFPDGYTAIPWRGKPASECPDGPRYRALGNSMAVPCMRWIGERIAQVHALP